MLPIIASIFNVTIDDLFDMDSYKKKEEIKQIVKIVKIVKDFKISKNFNKNIINYSYK